jgi:hypothetical protein
MLPFTAIKKDEFSLVVTQLNATNISHFYKLLGQYYDDLYA